MYLLAQIHVINLGRGVNNDRDLWRTCVYIELELIIVYSVFKVVNFIDNWLLEIYVYIYKKNALLYIAI